MPTTKRRAVGIVRVSRLKGREGETFASPEQQRERIAAACERDNLKLAHVYSEMDVSGGTPLEKREGLRAAVEAVEAGQAEVICAAYFDRLVRSLKVQHELIERVERAGGQVLAVDIGQVTNGSAGQWLSGTLLGAVSEYQRRTTAERSVEAQRRAVARGVAPFPRIPAGYERGADGVLVPSERVPAVAEAFRLRAEGATIEEVREHLRANGIKRSWHGVHAMLRNRTVLGEINFGKLVNTEAHEPIVDAETWQKAQRTVLRGTRLVSKRLLARQGVLRCGTCGARMVISTQSHNGRTYCYYRCPPMGDCEQRAAISADAAEQAVSDHVRATLGDIEGRASAQANVRDAEGDLERAQGDLDAAIRTLADFSDEPAARDRLTQLRDERDEAQRRLEQIGGGAVAVTINAATDWEQLTLDERRALVRATVDQATVAPGRGAERITIKAA